MSIVSITSVPAILTYLRLGFQVVEIPEVMLLLYLDPHLLNNSIYAWAIFVIHYRISRAGVFCR